MGWDESEPESASGAAAERELRRRNGRAVPEIGDVEKERLDEHDRAMGRYGIIVVGVEVEPGEPAALSSQLREELSKIKSNYPNNP